MFRRLRITRGYTSLTTRSAAKTLQDKPGLHRDAPGCLKDNPDGFMDLVDTRGWGFRTIIVIALTDVSLSIREFYDNIAGVPLGAIDHWIPGSQWL